MIIKNESYWLEIEELPAFEEDSDPRVSEAKAQAWRWLEMLQSGRRMTARDIIQLQGLLASVYAIGVHNGACNPYCG
jgi:hypothetical protein